MSSALDLVSSDTRRELLQIIKRRGSLSVDEAMEALDMARTTVRDHLLQLREKGLLDRTVEREGRGRPSHRYQMSRQAKMLFPSRDGELMGRLLQYLRDHGAADLVETFFEEYWAARTRAVKQRLRGEASDDVDEQLDVLRSILEEEGFMPEIDSQGERVTVRECNCPFPESVKQTKIPCRLEREFFEAIFEAELDRVTYIPEGHSACTYEVDRGKVEGGSLESGKV
jgi:predicted ArsR family transcriptional regulator